MKEREAMNKQRVNGAIDEVVGSAKRHIGNLTGNTRTQVEGAVQQLKGKAETAVGKLNDAVLDGQANPQTPVTRTGRNEPGSSAGEKGVCKDLAPGTRIREMTWYLFPGPGILSPRRLYSTEQ